LTVADVEATYFDDSRGSYNNIGSILDDATGYIRFQVNHLTSFAIVGNGDVNTATGEDSGDSGGGDDGGTGGTEEAASSASGGCGCKMGAQTNMGDVLAILIMSGIMLGIYIPRRFLKAVKRRV